MEMEVRYPADPVHFEKMNTKQIRDNFLIECLFVPGRVKMVYSFIDSVIIGSFFKS